MRRSAKFPVLVAVDDSPTARSVAAATLAFPWPEAARVHGVLATSTPATVGRPEYVRGVLKRSLQHAASRTERPLVKRWPGASVVLRDRPPVDAILAEAKRLGARAIVCGWRGHSALLRMLTGGSVSRGVVRRAQCPVLVVKRRPRDIRHLLIGLDGSPNAERAVAFVTRLTAPPGGRATLVRVVEPLRLHTVALLPGTVRATLSREVAAENASRLAQARRDVERAARVLARAGWRVRTLVREGVPLPELLQAVKAGRAHVLVVGARGAGRMRGLLLGSVAQGAVERADVPVLVVR
jgi:nucleotide-binding universal stress UspA family protein